jgi:hypothetical protein
MRAPSDAFSQACGIYRSDVSSHLYPWAKSCFPVRPVPGHRTSRKEHALPIVRDEFRPAIPQRVARQHCPPPLYRQPHPKTVPGSGTMKKQRTVNCVLTVCLSPGDNLSSVSFLPRWSITTHRPITELKSAGTITLRSWRIPLRSSRGFADQDHLHSVHGTFKLR